MGQMEKETRATAACCQPGLLDEETATRGATHNVGSLERWASVLTGAALGVTALRRGRLSGLLLAGAAAAMVYRGITGRCRAYQAMGVSTAKSEKDVKVFEEGQALAASVTVLRGPEELYSFWRELENLPKIMRHIHRVETIDAKRSRWLAEGLLGHNVQWEAEIQQDEPNRLIAWRSLPGSEIETAGSVQFEPLSEDRGTVVRVSLSYKPVAGGLGSVLAATLSRQVRKRVRDDLRRFKSLVEAGEIPTTVGQPRGPR